MASVSQKNLTAAIGEILVSAAEQHMAPNYVQETVFKLLQQSGIDIETAEHCSDCAFALAEFITIE